MDFYLGIYHKNEKENFPIIHFILDASNIIEAEESGCYWLNKVRNNPTKYHFIGNVNELLYKIFDDDNYSNVIIQGS
jgi:hypothetical protein